MEKNNSVKVELDTTGEFLSTNPAAESAAQPATRKSTYPREAIEFLAQNLQFLYAHKETILNNPKMFHTPVSVGHNLAYTGRSGLRNPNLGIVLMWLDAVDEARRVDENGDLELLYFFGGSPLSGCNISYFVRKDGSEYKSKVHEFKPLWKTFMQLNADYRNSKASAEAYSLETVIEMLKK